MNSPSSHSSRDSLGLIRNRREALRLATVSALAVGSSGRFASQASAQNVAIVATGLAGDGVSDDSPLIQQFIDRAANEGRLLIIPPGAYAVYSQIDARTGSRISAPGATLETYIDGLGNPGGSFPTLRIHSVTDVEIVGLSINGRKDVFPHTQWKHGFSLNDSARITIRNCTAFDCKGDGIILDDSSVGFLNEDILVEHSIFDGNYRNGGTAGGARNAEFRDCVFRGTIGTPPMQGFDVEPDREDVVCTDVRFVRCEFIDNGNLATGEGGGFNISFIEGAFAPQEGVALTDCIVAGNAVGGLDLYRVPKSVLIEHCDIRDNYGWGLRVYDEASEIDIDNSEITGNSGHGITVNPQNGAAVTDVSIHNVEVTDNGNRDGKSFDGINLMNNVVDVLISGCAIAGAPRYGVYIEDTVSNVRIEDTTFRNNGVADVFPEDYGEIDEQVSTTRL